jgi:acetylornithine deacetylase/succinyl-diaminopimelate desuccinylase-like protein
VNIRISLWLILCLLARVAAGQSSQPAQAARAWRQAHERAIVSELFDLLAIPNLASDASNARRNAETIVKMLEKRGVQAKLLEVAGAPPAVYGEIRTANARRTIVFYAHYDGQPLDPKEWATPPWQPVLRDRPLDKDGKIIPLPEAGAHFDPEWRIYGRSASDDKAPIIAMAAALDALHAAHIPLQSNIRFIFEGEEEAGSRHLGDIIADNKDLLGGDVWLICDGPVHQSRRQTIVFGARGVESLDITIYGAAHELHSGHYGNWAPNPAMMLAQLLASMKDGDGRVLIDHFYDGIAPLTETEKRALAEAPNADADLKREFALGHTDGGGKTLLELLNQPSLNIRGMSSSRIGAQASNVIPATASASLDIRLVKGIDHREAVHRVIEHIRKQGYFVVDHDPDLETRMSHAKVAKVSSRESGYNAVRTSMDLPISKVVIAAAESARGPVIKLPTMGGSVPLDIIENTLNVPTISTPIANHDNNQHSFNENLRIQNLWDGIELMAALIAGL